MTIHPVHPNRKSLRLPGYDYSLPRAYFVTLVSWQRLCLFAEIQQGECALTPIGKNISEEWLKTPTIRPNIEIDEFVIMPNHLHGIIVISSNAADVGAMRRIAPTITDHPIRPSGTNFPNGAKPGSIGAIVGQIKSMTTRRINKIRGTPGRPLWQRNYYERIIRNEEELNRIRLYIQSNPSNWQTDPEFSGNPL